jgi:hypothetical protein
MKPYSMECKYHTNKPPWKGKGGMRCTSGDLEIGSPKHRSPGNQNHPTTQQLETGSSLVSGFPSLWKNACYKQLAKGKSLLWLTVSAISLVSIALRLWHDGTSWWSKAVQVMVAKKQRKKQEGQGSQYPLQLYITIISLPSTKLHLLRVP